MKSKNKITTEEWGSKIYLIGFRSKRDVSIINCNIMQKRKDLTTNFTTQGFILTNFSIESHSKSQTSLSITSNNVIITLALNFKIAVLLFSNYRGSNNMIKENSTAKCQKYVTQCGKTLFKSKIWSFCWFKYGNWLPISIPVIKIILATKYSMHCFLHLQNGCNNKNFTIELERIKAITEQPQTQWIL